MTTTALPRPRAGAPSAGSRLDAVNVGQHAGRRQVLHDVTFSVRPGQLVAVMGPSGAGKTTLLEVLAGVRPPSRGEMRHDGLPLDRAGTVARPIGFVPQDDIVHADLPLRRTLEYAARLRPAASPAGQDRVDAVLDALGLAHRADVPVKRLSGGQRKRASIAVELLGAPGTLFLDEPTSGLDPATAGDVVRTLRRLADDGTTVVLTTHSTADAERCDEVVLLDRSGRLAYVGPPASAGQRFGVTSLEEVFEVLADPGAPVQASDEPSQPVRPVPRAGAARTTSAAVKGGPRAGSVRQSLLLARRNVETLVRSPLTLAVLVGSPVLVTVMLAVLFRPDLGAPGQPAGSAAQLAFWCAFSAFFFGVTYGLLQVVPELPVVRREHRGGLRPGAYVAAKMLALLPVLALVTAVLLGVLRALDRLPAAGLGVYTGLFSTMFVEAAAALALGLLASAAVSTPSQAALALPMLCFPQVLFAGGVVPVGDMALPGRVFSRGLANRYGFDAFGRELHTALGSSASDPVGTAGTVQGSWLSLLALTVVATALTVWVVGRRVSPATPRGSAGRRWAVRPA